MKYIYLYSFLVFFLAVSMGNAQNATHLIAYSIPETLKKNANAVVRFEEMTADIRAANRMIVSQKRIVTVLNENGDRHVHTSLPYDRRTSINSISVIVYNALGVEIKKIKKSGFEDRSTFDGMTLYSDARYLDCEYTPTTYPYTVVFEFEYTTSDTAVIPTWYFLDSYYSAVQESNYRIKYEEGLKIDVKEENFEGFAIEKSEKPQEIFYSAKNLQALKREEFAPPRRHFAPHLKVRLPAFTLKGVRGTAANWKEFGAWVNARLLKEANDLPVHTKDKIKSMVKGLSKLEAARVIHQYVQEKTRYISVQIGIGGWEPAAASEVDKLGYGDCKGLTNYTHALLEAAGIPSYYTILYASSRNKLDIDPNFTSLQGNHVILGIPNEDDMIWIDCTSQVHPFGFIGDFSDDRQVLVVKPEGGEIMKTTAYINEDNLQNIRAEFHLNSNSNLNGNVSIQTEGIQYDQHFHLQRKTEKEKIKHYKEDFWDYLNHLTIQSLNFDNNKDKVVFSETLDVSTANYGTVTGERLIFAPNVTNRISYVPKRYRNRKLPFEILRGFLDTDDITIHLPKGYQIESMLNTEKIESEFGIYEIKMDYLGDNQLHYTRKFLLKKGTYTKDKYNDFRNFYRAVSRMDNAKVVLLKKT